MKTHQTYVRDSQQLTTLINRGLSWPESRQSDRGKSFSLEIHDMFLEGINVSLASFVKALGKYYCLFWCVGLRKGLIGIYHC